MKQRDDNDRLQDGDLPEDPEADAELMPDPHENRRRQDLEATAARFARNLAGGCVDLAIERMRARADGRETPIPLPWSSLATALGGGLWPGLHVVVGNTGSGKSQLALQVALHAASQSVPALYLALELGREELVARLLGTISGRRWSDLWRGQDAEAERVFAECAGRLLEIPLHLEEAPAGLGYDELRPLAEGLRSFYQPLGIEGRPVLIVLDFLQLVASPSGAREDARERIGRAAYAGRMIARDLNAAVLLLSSTPRANYNALGGEMGSPGKGNPGTLVGMGKESGEIEFAADSVLALVREPWSDGEPPPGGAWYWCAVAKLRTGRPGWVPLLFDGCTFSEPSAQALAEHMQERQGQEAKEPPKSRSRRNGDGAEDLGLGGRV